MISVADLRKAKLAYSKRVAGLDVGVENPPGSVRKWPGGETRMLTEYGYVKRTRGADGEEVDCYVGPSPDSDRVFVINQLAKPGYSKFDEHKVILGAGSKQEALNIYLAHRDDGAHPFDSVVEMSVAEFKRWLAAGDTEAPIRKAQMYLGPRGGKWADPAHTRAWAPPHQDDPGNTLGIKKLKERLAARPKRAAISPEDKARFLETLAQIRVAVDAKSKLSGAAHIEATTYLDMAHGALHGDDHAEAIRYLQHVLELIKGLRSADLMKAQMPYAPLHSDEDKEKWNELFSEELRKAIDVIGAPHGWKIEQLPERGEPQARRPARARRRAGRSAQVAVGAADSSILKAASFLLIGDLLDLLKASRPSGSGWELIPKGRHGGYRRRRGKEFEYWYPGDAPSKPTRPGGAQAAEGGPGPETRWREEDYAAGKYDKDPHHWVWHQVVPGRPPIGWVAGGVRTRSKHPVKEAGHPERLYQIVGQPEPGWVRLRDVNSGEEIPLQEERVFPVELRKEKPAQKKPAQQTWDATKIGKPGPVTGVSEEARTLPPFEGSTAKAGTALADLEGGKFVVAVVKQRMSDGTLVQTRRLRIDSATKQRLVAEFGGMIENVAKKTKRGFGLSDQWQHEAGKLSVNLAMVELRQAAMEGFLYAIDIYPGGVPFARHAQFVARDYARLHAARERSGGLGMSARHRRLIGGFLAASAEARRRFGELDPTPEQIAKVWRLKKKDIHADLAARQGNEDVPRESYRIKHGDAVGKEMPGKDELAARYARFLAGIREPGDLSEESAALFPGLSMGLGLSAEERVVIHDQLSQVMDSLRRHTITIAEGRKSATYRANAGLILDRALGLSGDVSSIREISQTVKVQRKTADGRWVKLADRQARVLVGIFLERALASAKRQVEDDASRVIERVRADLFPPEVAPPGPTYGEIVKKRAASVSAKQISAFRADEAGRLATIADKMAERGDVERATLVRAAGFRVGLMDEAEVRLRIAQRTSPETALMRQLATKTVGIEVVDPNTEYGWAVAVLTDLRTGKTRRVRIRTMRDLRGPWEREYSMAGGHVMKKALAQEATTGMLREVALFPEVSRMLYGYHEDDALAGAGTIHRRIIETLLGVH